MINSFEHSHEEYEFILPLTPIPYLLNEGAVYFGETGWIFPVISGRSHGVKYNISDVSHYDILISKEYFEQLLEDKKKSQAEFNYSFRATKEFKTYVEAFITEAGKGKASDLSKLTHLSALICIELIDAGTHAQRDDRLSRSSYQRGMRSAAEFITDNYDKPFSLEELAAVSGFSVGYFSACFKKTFGLTPLEYAAKLRVSKAKLLLETTNLTLGEISVRCGFENLSSFSEAFKKSTGVRPSRFEGRLADKD